ATWRAGTARCLVTRSARWPATSCGRGGWPRLRSVRPVHRRQGRAHTAACAALADAVAAGLVAQWRSAVSNPASVALGERLGFVRLGKQMTVRVGEPQIDFDESPR